MKLLKNPKVVIPGVLTLAALAWLAFGYFAVHKIFIDDKVNEAAPTFSVPNQTTAVTTIAADDTAPPQVTVPVPTTVVSPPILTEATGTFVSLDHDTSGTVSVLGDGSGQRFLRIEDLNTSNGPDLNVYLVNSSTGDVSDFVDLGDLKGNIGDQNYEIPVGTDLSVYDKVLIWCVRFSSPFGEAALSAIP